jgi:amino acid adenylation domain-containing protein
MAWAYAEDCPFPDATTHDLILDQARRTPGAEAIRQWGQVLTYADLVEAAGSVAVRLRRAGVGPEVRVGICMRRTVALPVAVLGVWLAGGAYVPLDHNHPPMRLLDILTDAGAGIALVDEPGARLLAGSGKHLIEVAQPPGWDTRGPMGPARRGAIAGTGGARPENAAYVMYTSGSTGRPKGVTVSHRNLVAFAAAAHARSPLPDGCRSAAFASLAFDVFAFDVYVPLTLGAAVQLVPDEDRVDAARLARFLREHRVSRSMLPPAILPLLDPGDLPDLADIYVAGEPCGPEQVERWTAAGRRRFHNWYGPTETTVVVVSAELDGAWARPLPIGRPLPGCRAWVVDEKMRACPPGTPGELLIGGPQLARAYLGRPGHTAERFVPDPFGASPGERLYRTGDLVRWEADGMLAYLGRLDRQVKIQGQRVEIGELETILRTHPAVSQAVADVAAGPAGLRHLIAYVSPAGVAGLREYCAARLPAYMTPARIVRLDSLPLNVSGKVDLEALRALAADAQPEPSAAGSPEPPAAARQAPERLVAQAWAEVFETAQPGPDEDFIASGGHSLLAMRLAMALRSRSGRQVGVDDVYRAGTVAGLTAALRQAPPLRDQDAVPAGAPAALSAAQRRMWFTEQLTPGSPVHNVAMSERIRGRLDAGALHTALRTVERQHEVLRWRVAASGGAPGVAVGQPGQFCLRVEDLTGLPAGGREAAARELLEQEATAPFSLSTGPLWRATLIRLAPDEHVLAVTVHHIVFDGWSRDVLYADLGRAYRAALAGDQADTCRGDDPPAAVGYADYVAWSASRAERQSNADIAWWLEHLSGASLVLDLPRDAPRPPVRTFSGAMAEADAGPRTSAAVREAARQAGATPFVVLLSAFAQLACRLTGQDDLVIGTPAADRGNVAFEQVIGLCLHMLPLRFTVCHDLGFADHVRRCRDELAAAQAHPNAPLERIVESLGQARDLSRNPLFQVLFNGYDLVGSRLDMAGLEVTPVLPGLPGSLFDLTMYVTERDDRFAIRAVYNPDLYSAARVEALLASYLALLARLTADPRRPVSAASMRPDGGELPDERAPLRDWAGTGVIERVRAAAVSEPGAPAVTGHGGLVTYAGLSAARDRTAAALRAAGVAAGDTVAVLAGRDTRLPAILLGVLASGARWLILDPAVGDPRIVRQLTAARARALIRFPGTALPAGLDPGLAVLGAAALAAEDRSQAEAPWAVAADADAPARGYLSLTSGTTGEPRPVLTSERPLAHFLDWYATEFRLGARDRFALLSGLAHDPLLRDVLTPLVLGGCLCVPKQEWLRDPATLTRWLHAERVTVAHLTPQAARLLTTVAGPAALPALRLIALGGDMATMDDVARLRVIAPGARIVNFYGTTETPQAQAWHDPGAGETDPAPGGPPLPVGRGIDGAQLLVTSPRGGLAGVGELGEVVIRSRYLAVGYIGGEPATSRFLPAADSDAEDRRFVTGDLGRYRPDGTVVLAGRGDDQLKVRGFRVELGEVETVLAAHPDVRQACVCVTRGADERQLWAYVVPVAPGVAASRLHDHMRANLPEYAVPAGVSLVPAMPLTANGKVDRAALRRPAPGPGDGPSQEFASSTERLIARIWSEVLGVPRLSATDNFFEIGGHSLAIVAVQARLARALGRDVPVLDLFSNPAIRSLAAYLDGASGHGQGEGLERAALRAAQRRDRARRRSDRQPKGVS